MLTRDKKILIIIIALLVIFALSTLTAVFIIKYSYHKDFTKECYRTCYYDKTEKIWEYRPWGYDTEYTKENRDFPLLRHCLNYCLSQKEIDFLK